MFYKNKKDGFFEIFIIRNDDLRIRNHQQKKNKGKECKKNPSLKFFIKNKIKTPSLKVGEGEKE